MRELTAWKVFQTKSTDGEQQTVIVAFDPVLQHGIVEEFAGPENYKLVGKHNNLFDGAQQLWMEWKSENLINTVTDISANYE